MKSNSYRSLSTRFAIVMFAMVITLIAPTDTVAQQPPIKRHRSVKKKPIPKVPSAPEPSAKPLLSPRAAEPVAIVNLARPDYLSGEASVTVNPKQPTVIRLGLAQNAVAIVEFPAADGIYYVHEGNPKLASVFQSPTRETDRSITIYPGEGFVSSSEAHTSTAITLQMRSGLVIILELVPVGDVRRNAHRCVVTYSRDEIISARRAAGLAYDLGEDAKTPVGKSTNAASSLFGPKLDEAFGDSRKQENSPQPLANESPIRTTTFTSPATPGRSSKISDAEISRVANKKLAEVLKNPAKHLSGWNTVVSGLSLGVSKITDIDRERRIVIVAVRNTTMSTLRLVSGAPELQLQTQNDKGSPLQTERIEREFTEMTTPDGVLPAGSTVYYAIVYRPPTMGANQRLRLLFAHTEAADAPVSVSLSNANDGRKDR